MTSTTDDSTSSRNDLFSRFNSAHTNDQPKRTLTSSMLRHRPPPRQHRVVVVVVVGAVTEAFITLVLFVVVEATIVVVVVVVFLPAKMKAFASTAKHELAPGG